MEGSDQEMVSLKHLNEDLENYFANTIIPQLFVDANLKLRKFTPTAIKQFDLRADDIGKLLSDICDDISFPAISKEIRNVIKTGEFLQKEIQTTDMRWFQMDIHPYVVRSENTVNGVIISFIDITVRIKELEGQKKLMAENELLIDTIAHDIKNPLAALEMSIAFLNRPRGVDMEQLPALLNIVKESVAVMNKVFNDLIKPRWNGRRYESEPEILDLEEILKDVRHTLAPQINEYKVVFRTAFDNTKIFFPKRSLRSIIYNLVNNALKYRSKNVTPVIEIKSFRLDKSIVITISDNGIGINPEDQDVIFNKFRQLDDSVIGDGIGLYLVKEILENLGGKVAVESKLGYGSTFSVYLKQKDDLHL